MNAADIPMMSWALESYAAQKPRDYKGKEKGIKLNNLAPNWLDYLIYTFGVVELVGIGIPFPPIDSPIRQKVLQIELQMYGLQTGSSMIYVCQTENQRSRTKAKYKGPKRFFMTERAFLSWIWNANPSNKWSWDDSLPTAHKFREMDGNGIQAELKSPEFQRRLSAIQGGIDLLILDEQWITPNICSPGESLAPFGDFAEDVVLIDPTGTAIDYINGREVIDEEGECRCLTDAIYTALHDGHLDHRRWLRI